MIFTSDNAAGMPPEILDAIARANSGHASSYGADGLSARVEVAFAELFECEVAVFMVATGTAANAIALSTLTESFGAILCHEEAHIEVDECGAPEFYTGGAKLVLLEGEGALLSPEAVSETLSDYSSANQHSVQPRVLSLTQATECGRVYAPAEIAALATVARAHDLAVHMDGARFANAMASLGCAPADITWKAGVDVLSFGATKNGCMAAEAILIFDRAKADEMRFRRKRGGHLWSKARFLAAQLDAYLTDDRWLTWAGHANAMARRLSDGLAARDGVSIAWPTDANEVFAIMPRSLEARLKAAGAAFYEWPGKPPRALGPDEMLARLVCSFATTEAEIEALLATA